MGGEIDQTTAAIDAITSLQDVIQLKSLERAIDAFFAHPDAAAHVAAWFRLFERFPEDDAYEMFWTVLHGIEGLPNYESELIDSLRRLPSRFPVLMVNRMLNAGQTQAEGLDLMDLMESIACDGSTPPSVRDDAKNFVKFQRNRA